MITYDDFAKLDIRIGTIRSVEKVPDTDKLLKFSVDFGELGDRTIVSGIADRVGDIESLIGKQFPFIVNLEPRVLRGIESQGMILAVGGEAVFALLSPHKEVPPGSIVR